MAIEARDRVHRGQSLRSDQPHGHRERRRPVANAFRGAVQGGNRPQPAQVSPATARRTRSGTVADHRYAAGADRSRGWVQDPGAFHHRVRSVGGRDAERLAATQISGLPDPVSEGRLTNFAIALSPWRRIVTANKKDDKIDDHRRRFFGAAAVAFAGAQFGMMGGPRAEKSPTALAA